MFEVPYLGNGVYSTTITDLAAFDANPIAFPTSLAEDASGNLFGTSAPFGGPDLGNVFELPYLGNGTYSSTITQLAAFNGANGGEPNSLVVDASGNLFGISSNSGNGTVFELQYLGNGAYSSSITTRTNFNGTDGSDPSGVVLDQAGNLFGTTNQGGANNDGTVFECLAFSVPRPA